MLYWTLLVILLFGVHRYELLMEQTRLEFMVTLQNQPLYDATTSIDRRPILSGQKISLGSHTITFTHPKGVTYSTNLFFWFGDHNLGTIELKRAMGTLTVAANPPANRLVVRGSEWSVTRTNCPGLTELVPTDDYNVEARYPHSSQNIPVRVTASQASPCNIAPHFGGLKIGCNQSDATFQLQSADGQLVSDGALPATVSALPAGDYKLIASHHGNQQVNVLSVTADTITSAQSNFQYGKVSFETSPPGVTIVAEDGGNRGETPTTLVEELPGNSTFTLQRSGYQTVQVSVNVQPDQTSYVNTNLISQTFFHAMTTARHYMDAADYDHALQAVNDALAAKPGDTDAVTLQREATGLGIIKHAETMGQQGDFIGGGKEMKRALQFLPDNAEAMRMIADFKLHEPEQIERMRVERLALPKKTFDAFARHQIGAELFESHELITSNSAVETHSAIETQLKSAPPFFQIVWTEMTNEIFKIEAKQQVSGGERICVIVGGQSKDDETQIFFEVIERKKVGFMNQPLFQPTEYTVINPSQTQLSDKLKKSNFRRCFECHCTDSNRNWPDSGSSTYASAMTG